MRERSYDEAARTAVMILFDEIRRLSGSDKDGERLVNGQMGVQPGKLAFSDCGSDSARSVTNGLKQMAQGLYSGVRNPTSHGWQGFDRVEALQVMVSCSLLLARLEMLGPES